MKKLYNKILIVTLFAIAMGLLESAVVVYLREIMYPEGFNFPLAPIPSNLALTEILREMATIIMLAGVGILAGENFSQRFAWFIFSFAIWDIFYYVFLWVLLGWPESFMTWDILFLIPATWTGPVITPLLVTVVMILLAVFILIASEKGVRSRLIAREWIGLTGGSIILIVAFTTDYIRHMLKEFSLFEMMNIRNETLQDHAMKYIPDHFPWFVFLLGLFIILGFTLNYGYRIRKTILT